MMMTPSSLLPHLQYDEVQTLIKINSISQLGNEELVNFLLTCFQNRGIHAVLQHVIHSSSDFSKKQWNIIGFLGNTLVDRKTKKGLLLSAPLDTTPPGLYQHWTHTQQNPFEATIKGDQLFGLGTSQGKIDFLCKLAAIEKFRGYDLQYPIYLAGTCGATLGGVGAQYLTQSSIVNPKKALLCAPTQNVPMLSSPSLQTFSVVLDYQVTEKDAKGFSRKVEIRGFGTIGPMDYEEPCQSNTILDALDLMLQAREYGFEMYFSCLKGGESVLQKPHAVTLEFYLTAHQLEDFKQFFADQVHHYPNSSFVLEASRKELVSQKLLDASILSVILEIITLCNTLMEEELVGRGLGALSQIGLCMIRHHASSVELVFSALDHPEPTLWEKLRETMVWVNKQHQSFNLRVSKKYLFPKLLGDAAHPLWRFPSEAGHHQKKGTEVQLYSAGNGESIYQYNEYVAISKCVQAITFYEEAIKNFLTWHG